MRKHAKARVYVAMLIMMVCAVFVLHYSHWGSVRYRQSIARAGRGILPDKHHRHKHRQPPGPGKLHHQRHEDNVIPPVRHKKGRYEGREKDVPVMAPVRASRIPPVGQRGVKPPPQVGLRHQNNYRRLVTAPKDDRGRLLPPAGKGSHTRANNTVKSLHSLPMASNRRQNNVHAPRLSRQSATMPDRRQNGIFPARVRHRSTTHASKTTTHAPKTVYQKVAGAVLKTSGSTLGRVGGLKPRHRGTGRLGQNGASNVVRMRQ